MNLEEILFIKNEASALRRRDEVFSLTEELNDKHSSDREMDDMGI